MQAGHAKALPIGQALNIVSTVSVLAQDSAQHFVSVDLKVSVHSVRSS